MKRGLALVLISIFFINIFLVGNAVAQSKIRNFAERIKTSPGENDSNEKENVGEIEGRNDVDVRKEGRNIEQRGDRIKDKDEVMKIRKEFRDKIKEHNGDIEVEGRKRIRIRERDNEGEEKEIIAGRINATTELNLTADDLGNWFRLRAILSNGRFADVKIMPDGASVIALERLRAKCLERNCSVELKEVGKGNETKAAYELETEKDSNIFFIFKKKMKVRAEIDAETGEIILIEKPWWAFFAKEKDENESEDIEKDVEVSETGNQTIENGIINNSG